MKLKNGETGHKLIGYCEVCGRSVGRMHLERVIQRDGTYRLLCLAHKKEYDLDAENKALQGVKDRDDFNNWFNTVTMHRNNNYPNP